MSSPKLAVPDAVREIAQRLEGEGYATWAVGGAVRDSLAPQPQQRPDWDLASAAEPEMVRKLFKRSFPIGLEFGTVGVMGSDGTVYEVTTFRRDVSTDGRHAVVEYSESIEEDLARRDFTINAIAYHPLRHELLDPYGGRDDLRQGVLRCVGDPQLRFREDYLRVLRGLRFAGRYELEIEPATYDALKNAVSHIDRLSAERVREELVKVLEGPNAPSSLHLYRDSGALAAVIPELAQVDDERWGATLRAIDAIGADQADLRRVLLLAPTRSGIEPIMRRLKFSNSETRDTVALAAALERDVPSHDQVVEVRRWLRDVTPELASAVLSLLGAHALGERGARGVGGAGAAGAGEELDGLTAFASAVGAVLDRGDALTLADLAIDGNDLTALGCEPGPEYSEILRDCLEAVIERPELNERGKLIELVKERRAR